MFKIVGWLVGIAVASLLAIAIVTVILFTNDAAYLILRAATLAVYDPNIRNVTNKELREHKLPTVDELLGGQKPEEKMNQPAITAETTMKQEQVPEKPIEGYRNDRFEVAGSILVFEGEFSGIRYKIFFPKDKREEADRLRSIPDGTKYYRRMLPFGMWEEFKPFVACRWGGPMSIMVTRDSPYHIIAIPKTR